MVGRALAVLEHRQRRGGGGLGDHPHAAIGDGVLGEAFAGQGGVVARRPLRPTAGGQGDQAGGAGVLALGRSGFSEEGHGVRLRTVELRTKREHVRVERNDVT
jgi:hypothetical protein